MASGSDPPFFHNALDKQTDTQTDRWLTIVCDDRPLSLHRQQRGMIAVECWQRLKSVLFTDVASLWIRATRIVGAPCAWLRSPMSSNDARRMSCAVDTKIGHLTPRTSPPVTVLLSPGKYYSGRHTAFECGLFYFPFLPFVSYYIILSSNFWHQVAYNLLADLSLINCSLTQRIWILFDWQHC